MSEAVKDPAALIEELLRMVDEFLKHMDALEAENRNLRAQLVSSGSTPAPAAGDPVPVLVVDPEASRAEELIGILRRCGCQGTHVTGGDAALARLRSEAFHLVVVESELGSESGLDFVKRLREAAPEAECLIVVGFTSADTAVQALRLGASAFCIRPVQEDELQARVGELLQKRHIAQRSRRYLNDLRERFARIANTYKTE